MPASWIVTYLSTVVTIMILTLQMRKLGLFKTSIDRQDLNIEAGRLRFDLINYDKPPNDFCDLVDSPVIEYRKYLYMIRNSKNVECSCCYFSRR